MKGLSERRVEADRAVRRIGYSEKSYLATLAEEAGEEVEADLTKAEASKRIDALQEKTGCGA